MPFNPRIHLRKLHRWASVIILLPFLVVLLSGLLQVKRQVDWIQPLTQAGSASGAPGLALSEVLNAAAQAGEAGIAGWEDVDRMDVRPAKGVVKVRATNGWEVQVDAHTGDVLQVAQRRSDVIEAIHDGSWFHESAKLWVFLPSAVLVLGLWVTGAYLFALPSWVRWQKPKATDRKPAKGVDLAELPRRETGADE
jgi:uncharacterized iron-regulated membrane protein